MTAGRADGLLQSEGQKIGSRLPGRLDKCMANLAEQPREWGQNKTIFCQIWHETDLKEEKHGTN